eukprot:CAMPEP_0174240126 /NCGR_PEP_ID=MMETSP0417-20130205/17516_1 /TAXON_ID=242541 /ORGANISM="Mayorella sp, Strain BSH-02190019" /LENGTH=53 /DNA_ID=CAMNT_0015319161 /DNA_START=1 /DNA_END=159 /DNA_ORIENTATION=+
MAATISSPVTQRLAAPIATGENNSLPSYRLVDRRQSERFWKVDGDEDTVITPR